MRMQNANRALIMYMEETRFTWDEDKNFSNQRKHGLSFEVAARVFLDPLHLSVQDRIEGGEQRWQTVGQIDGFAVVLVAHTFTKPGPTDEPIEVTQIISARLQHVEKGNDIKKVEHTPDTLPSLTEAQKKSLKCLAAMPDDEIDKNDIPELTDAQLAEMKRPEHYRPVKKQIMARLDADVLAWLKAGSKGYQSRMNAILRQAMLNAK